MLSNQDKQVIKGKLKVRALRPTRRGVSDHVIPQGSIGYVCGRRDDQYLIFWPENRQYPGDNKLSSHAKDDVEGIGRG